MGPENGPKFFWWNPTTSFGFEALCHNFDPRQFEGFLLFLFLLSRRWAVGMGPPTLPKLWYRLTAWK